MNTDSLQHPLVRAAIIALNGRDRTAWLILFSADALLTDDGNSQDLVPWSDNELFGADHGQLTTVTRQEDGGLSIYGNFHSSRWGDFNTFMRFQVQDGKIVRLDVGQSD
jgi:hypothetical protein